MKKEFDLDHLDIKKLVADKERFSDLVYFSPSEAKNEIKKRWENNELEKKIERFLEGDIPEPLVKGYKAVLFRQLFSPNYELLHFINIVDALGLEPLFLEYHDDKFTSMNPIKHCLGKLSFQETVGGNATMRIKSQVIIDFNGSQGQQMKEVKTIWSQPLIDFHHELLESVIPSCKKYLFDASGWFHRKGDRARNYYLKYIALFIRNGICFENFILEGDELRFVKDVFLPNFIEIWKLLGEKPIFVELLPTSTQNDKYWMSYPVQTRQCIQRKIVVK